MHFKTRCLILLALLACAAEVSSQETSPPNSRKAGGIVLDVVVSSKDGSPAGRLEQKDFTVLDNKVSRTLTSFESVDGRYAAAKVIILVDAVNADYPLVSFERAQIGKFLRSDEGRLERPMELAVLTDTGVQTLGDFSTDGNTLSAALDKYAVSLRAVRRAAGDWGDIERTQYSLNGLRALVAHRTAGGEREIILCLSPGWPFLEGPQVDFQLDKKKRQHLFDEITGLSTELSRARVTLYAVDPGGSGEAGSSRRSYWESYVKGVTTASQAQMGDLALQVLAAQSGGAVVTANNDITAMLRECLSDLHTYYEISFDPPPGDPPNTYHRLEIQVAGAGLAARARQGYYSR